jgi:ferredoxin-type protein NapH
MKFEIHRLQVLRRVTQVGVVLLMLSVPAISRYGNYVAAYDIDGRLDDWSGTLAGTALMAIDGTFRKLPGGEVERVGETVRSRDGVLRYAQGIHGGPWSFEISRVSMSDPLGALESIIARKHVASVVAVSLIIPVVFTVLFGRIFCSWICPMGLLLEITDTFRPVLKFLEIHPRNMRFSRATKYALLAVGLLFTAVSAVPILGYVYPPAIINREGHDLIFNAFDRAEIGLSGLSLSGLTWMSFILLGIVVFEVLVSRRWWCRYVCPGGGLYSLLGVFRPVRVKLIESKCTHCSDCVVACPVGLNPMNNEMGMECDNCGECISSCHDDALKFALPLRKSARTMATESNPAPTK